MAWTRDDAAHLLRRAGFGGSAADVEALFVAGQAGAIGRLLNYDAVPDPVWDDVNPLLLPLPLEDDSDAARNLLYKLIVSQRPLQSRLLWFWHGHFTSSIDDTGPVLMLRQVETWRRYATGNFLEFLLAMWKDGGMLDYLDGKDNEKENPNENFARENWELFTMGAGTFTENDVREAARAFTGYEVGRDKTVSFDVDDHDFGTKTILGQTGNFGGDDVMRITFGRPETMARICTKLYQHFVSERVNALEVGQLTAAWSNSGGNLNAVIQTLLVLPGFWNPLNRGALVKSAMEYCIGLVQRLELIVNVDLVTRMAKDLEQMGQTPFEPPNVSGYPTGLRLTGAGMLLARYRFAHYAIYEVSPGGVTAVMTTGLPVTPSRDQFIATLASRLGLISLGANTRSALNDYLGTSAIDSSNIQGKTLGTLYLLACSPEFQLT
jgi:uncharacterized protein (DUF1800 family)